MHVAKEYVDVNTEDLGDEDLHSAVMGYVGCTSICGLNHMDDVQEYAECKSKCAKNDDYFKQFSKDSDK